MSSAGSQNELMPTITVHTPFRLTLTDGAPPVSFGVGAHVVEDEIAQHWYVQAHTEPLTEATAEPLTPPIASATDGGVDAEPTTTAPPKKKK